MRLSARVNNISWNHEEGVDRIEFAYSANFPLVLKANRIEPPNRAELMRRTSNWSCSLQSSIRYSRTTQFFADVRYALEITE